MVFSLFKKKKKVVEISLDDVDEWIKKKIESKNLNLKLSMYKRELYSKISKINELLDDLSEAEIKDKSVIPERARSMFEGNKSTYIKKIRSFINELDFPNDISEIENFLESASLGLEELARETNKNYFIIKDFAENDVRKVANKLKELDKVIIDARETIEKSSLDQFKKLKKLLVEYHENVKKVEDSKVELEKLMDRRAKELERRKKVEFKITSLKKSPQHDDCLNLKNSKKSLEEELKRNEYSVINLFSGLASALKKFGKVKKNKIAREYSDNAVDALIDDKNFKILKVLDDVKKNKKSLDIKDSKIKKLDSEIDVLNKDVLDELRNNILSIKKELGELENRIKNHPYTLNLKEEEGKIGFIDENLKEIDFEIQRVEDVLERVNPRLVKQKMKYLIKEIDVYTELI